MEKRSTQAKTTLGFDKRVASSGHKIHADNKPTWAIEKEIVSTGNKINSGSKPTWAIDKKLFPVETNPLNRPVATTQRLPQSHPAV